MHKLCCIFKKTFNDFFFIGLASWQRRFISNFTELIQRLQNLLSGGNVQVASACTVVQQRAWDVVIKAISSVPVLTHPDYLLDFQHYRDISDSELGACLTQRQASKERLLGYFSRRLHPSERSGYQYLHCIYTFIEPMKDVL